MHKDNRKNTNANKTFYCNFCNNHFDIEHKHYYTCEVCSTKVFVKNKKEIKGTKNIKRIDGEELILKTNKKCKEHTWHRLCNKCNSYEFFGTKNRNSKICLKCKEKERNNRERILKERQCKICGKTFKSYTNDFCKECNNSSNLFEMRECKGTKLDRKCKLCGTDLIVAYHNSHFCGNDYIECGNCGDEEFITNAKQLRDFLPKELQDFVLERNKIIIPDYLPEVYSWCSKCRNTPNGKLLRRKYRFSFAEPKDLKYLSPFISINGDKIRLRSSYEFIYALYLHLNNIKFSYESELLFLNDESYIPDFLVDGVIHEVKGDIKNSVVKKLDKISKCNGYEFILITPEKIEECKKFIKAIGIDINMLLENMYKSKKTNKKFLIDFNTMETLIFD